MSSSSSSSVSSSPDISDDEYARRMNDMRSSATFEPVRMNNTCNNTAASNSSSPDITDVELAPHDLELFTTFKSMGLEEELLHGIYAFGIDKPSVLQQKAIMPILNGKDVMIQANAGSGKTTAFTIALLQSLDTTLSETQVLVLTPTRASATEVQEAVFSLGDRMNVQCHACVDGTTSEEDFRQVQYGQHVVSGTPDLILDIIKYRVLRTGSIKMLILDEVDVMVVNGFKEQIYEIYHYLSPALQVIFLSATPLPYEVYIMETELTSNAISIMVKPDDPTVDVLWNMMPLFDETKEFEFDNILRYFLHSEQPVVFCDSKEKVLYLAQRMQEANFAVSSIHGDMTQKERNHIMKEFRSGISRVLVSTFDCERDIKVEQQSLVVNFEVPTNHDHYLLRYGRPARFGPEGVSVRFADEDSIILEENGIQQQEEELIFGFVDV